MFWGLQRMGSILAALILGTLQGPFLMESSMKDVISQNIWNTVSFLMILAYFEE